MDKVLETPERDPDEKIYSYREKALRDMFITEYLVDYDEVAAAIRCGYGSSYARDYAVKFMHESYVQKQIKSKELVNKEDGPEELKQRIMAGLIREANYRGPGCSQSARVAALSKLASLNGMDQAIKTESKLLDANGNPIMAGTFVIPGLMTPEQWENAASAQQDALVSKPTQVSASITATPAPGIN